MRVLILIILYIGVVGTGAELILLGHYEDYRQWAPLVLFVAGLLAGLGLLARPGRTAIYMFRMVMVGFVVAGVVGMYFHYTGNAEFELEMYPAMAGGELIWESLTGATPALAPGTVTQLGLLGLTYTFRHPWLTLSET